MYKYAIIVAGGTGSRMGSEIPKQFLLLQGKPVLWYPVRAFTEAFPDIELILVLPEKQLQAANEICSGFPANKFSVIPGGDTRYASVTNGLKMIKQESIVFVHDAVRCLVTASLIRSCYQAALEKGNAIPAIAATDTIRVQTGDTNAQLDRNSIRLIQTPQVFQNKILQQAFLQPYSALFTDEASVVEMTGVKINLIAGEENNIKITRPVDLVIASSILSTRASG